MGGRGSGAAEGATSGCTRLARPVSKLRIVGQYFQFLGEQKKWWLLPLVVVLLLLGVVIVLTQGSAVAPFIYTLF